MKKTSPKKGLESNSRSKLKPEITATEKTKNKRGEQKLTPDQAQINSELRYRHLFENNLSGFAYCKMIFQKGQPQDFLYLEVNSAFESLTGLKDVVGQIMSEVIPGFRESDPGLLELFGRVALTDKPERLETYVKALKRWFSISVYSPQKEYFVAVYDEISDRLLASEYFRKLVDATPDSIVVVNPSGKITLVNLQAEKLFGFSRNEILGKNIESLIPERFKAIHDIHRLNYFNKPLYRQMGAGPELYGLTKGGTEFPVEISLSPFQTEEGLMAMAAIRDVSERKRVEAKLHQSEESFSLLVQSVEEFAIFMLDSNGLVASWNKGAERIKGYKAEEILGKHFSQFYIDVDVKKGKPERVLTITKKTSHYQEEGWRVRKDGSQFMADVTITALYNEAGELRGFAKVIRDITERRKAEAALARSEHDYRTLFENMPIGLYRTAADGRFQDVNEAMVKMFGYSNRESLLAENVVELYLDPASDRKFKTEIEKTGVVSNFESEFRRADGTVFWTEDHIRIIRDEDGNPLFYEGSLLDITKRKQAEERIQRQIEHLAALRAIDQVIMSSFDVHSSLIEILEHVTKELSVDAADVLILSSGYQSLDYSAGVGFRTKAAEKAKLQLGEGHAGRVVMERTLIQIPNLKVQLDDIRLKTMLTGEDFVCYYGVPLIAKGIVKGVLEVYHRSPLDPDQEWFEFLNTLAGQAALAIDNASLFENLQRSNIDLTLAYDATIEGWSRAMDLRDKETEGHTQRVSALALELASLFGFKDEDLVNIRRGTLLHDIGKMGVPDRILLKDGPLTDEEWILMRKHPTLAIEMLSPISYLQSALEIPYCHHEKWDGTGYPRALKGTQIPMAARIFSIVDVWDALTSDRPYRKAWSNKKTLEYLRSESGTSFDPAVLKICLEAGVFDRMDRK